MENLISRAAAIDAIVSTTSLPDVDSIKSIYNIGNGDEWVDGLYDAIIAVEKVNVVDAAPVRHGRIIKPKRWGEWSRCSLCDGTVPIVYNYCPHCGAKMDGGDHE